MAYEYGIGLEAVTIVIVCIVRTSVGVCILSGSGHDIFILDQLDAALMYGITAFLCLADYADSEDVDGGDIDEFGDKLDCDFIFEDVARTSPIATVSLRPNQRGLRLRVSCKSALEN